MRSTGKTYDVVSATQSPLNEKRWLCKLSCGHEVWVTKRKQPTKALCTRTPQEHAELHKPKDCMGR